MKFVVRSGIDHFAYCICNTYQEAKDYIEKMKRADSVMSNPYDEKYYISKERKHD